MNLFVRLFSQPQGFGTARIRRQRIEGSITVLGTGAPQIGLEAPEVGISASEYRARYFPQIRAPLLDNVGEIRNWLVSTVASREITIVGEVLGSTGVMAYTFLASVTPANDSATFGSPTGGLYMTEAEEYQVRAQPRGARVQLRSDPGVA